MVIQKKTSSGTDLKHTRTTTLFQGKSCHKNVIFYHTIYWTVFGHYAKKTKDYSLQCGQLTFHDALLYQLRTQNVDQTRPTEGHVMNESKIGGLFNNIQMQQFTDQAQIQPFVRYLTKLGLLIGVDQDTLNYELHLEHNLKSIQLFSNQSVQKILILAKHQNSVMISLEWTVDVVMMSSLLIIKKNNFNIYSDTPVFKISDMVQVMNIPYSGEGSLFSSMHNHIHNYILPMLNAQKPQIEKKTQNQKNFYKQIQRKLNQVNLTLIQSQKNFQVPQFTISYHQNLFSYFQEKKNNPSCPQPQFKDQVIKGIVETSMHWNRNIALLLKHTFDLSQGNIVQQEHYWINYLQSMNDLLLQLNKEQTQLTIEFLKKKGKMHVTVSFESQFGNLKKAIARIQKINLFFKEVVFDYQLNLQHLFSRQSLKEVKETVSYILERFITIEDSIYQIKRAYEFLMAFSKDMTAQILKILSEFKLMTIPFNQFIVIINGCEQIFKKFTENWVSFRQKNKNKGNIKQIFSFAHQTLNIRLKKLNEVRELYEKLKTIIENIIKKDKKGNPEENFLNTQEIEEGYKNFETVNILDLSKEGQEKLTRSEKYFFSKIDKSETYITQKLRETLGKATNANQMFRIFDKFNGLFFRPRIQSAIKEYQSQLLKTVKKDIMSLNDKFIQKPYHQTQNSKICLVRDIPLMSGSVIWAKQIKTKLNKYIEKVSKILGRAWTQHPEGKQCRNIGDAFDKKLNLNEMIKSWYTQMTNFNKTRQYGKEKTLILVKRKKLEIEVNFDDRLISLSKELRNLKYMKVKVHHTSLMFFSESARNWYPHAVSLRESVHSFSQICQRVDQKIFKLIAAAKRSALTVLAQGLSITWSEPPPRVQKFVKNVSEVVLNLDELVSLVNEKYEYISMILKSFQNCPLEQELLRQKLNKIQEIIDQFNLKEVSNLHIWVPELNERIEKIFLQRLKTIIQQWIKQFKQFNSDEPKKYITKSSIHQLKIKDQQIYLDPPIQYARFEWIQKFHKTMGIICMFPKLDATRYQATMLEKQRSTFQSALGNMDIKYLKSCYETIFKMVNQCEEYVNIWLSYESLWRIDANKIYEKLGDDINEWQNLLNQIKQNRKTFDNSETEKEFGPIVIDYRMVLLKINNKYDGWHKQILAHFGEKVYHKSKRIKEQIYNYKNKLQRINFLSPSQIIHMITQFQVIKKKFMEWGNQVEGLRSSNKLLERQRYSYPDKWISQQEIDSEWNHYKNLFQRKASQFDTQIPRLQQRLREDEHDYLKKIKEIDVLWNQQKPMGEQNSPREALDILSILNQRLESISTGYYYVCKAKELLGLEGMQQSRLEIIKQQIEGLKQVWNYLQTVWKPIENIKDNLINATTIKKIKEVIDQAQNIINDIPMKLKSYEAYDKMRNKLKKYAKMNRTIIELKSEAMKPRHWKTLLNKLKLTFAHTEITFIQLWIVDLVAHQNIIKDIMNVARGQMVLQQMILKIKDFWTNFQIETVRYQSKCKLIKGWDDLFTKLDQDLNTISSTRISPYFKTFESQIVSWDQKLQKIRITLDTWIDVQRRWVYLQGIFMGSSDIKEMLNPQYTRFKGIDSQFISLMKKVSNKPNLLEIMNIAGLQKTLQRLSDLLANIQKALGEYLETQRQAFARFYFVGDQDLLEIIGNSKDVTIVQKHFTKMYAGITQMKDQIIDGEDKVIQMSSRQGQVVGLITPVNITEDSKINVWLTKVDNQMRLTLAQLLNKVIIDIEQNRNNQDQLIAVIQKYPAQVVLLGLQVLWSEKVESALSLGGLSHLLEVEKYIVKFLGLLAQNVMKDLRKDLRQKFEQAITDFVHQRDVIRILYQNKTSSPNQFSWEYFMRMVYFPKEADILKKLQIKMGNSSFHYGFQYLGIGQKLVQTPLTDKCYLTLTQALHLRMGGSPFGPAGTGKTESVKALGAQLGRFVLVFNCDETFDFHAMRRIFIGLCQVGAWGCFDQFNRLQERMLSACSQQILVIQIGLRKKALKIELNQKEVKLNHQMGIFVTMNPGYAGRSNLPQNLKQLFRQMAMVKPDRQLIAQVMLYSQGYKTAQKLAGKIVSLFQLCADQLSSQPHYDFGLRSLKSVLVSAGNMKREQVINLKKIGKNVRQFDDQQIQELEQKILLRSVSQTMVPKLIAEDIPLLSTLLSGVFPGFSIPQIQQQKLRQQLDKICKTSFLLPQKLFIEKVLQLFQIQRIHHGVMMVGPSGCGKSKAWQTLMQAMEKVDQIKGESYVIDPKAINKDQLYGKLDSTTLQWTDGVFTGVLRKICENQRGESNRRHWIIFDGDVDPEWAQNLNSVLDDNKLLTLPNGQRLQIPPNVRIMFEVQTLKYATLATVSRCGMVWFSEEIMSFKMYFHHYLSRLRQQNYDQIPKGNQKVKETAQKKICERCVQTIEDMFENGLVQGLLIWASHLKHVMEYSHIRVIEATFSLIKKGISNVIEYNQTRPQYLPDNILESYMQKWTLQSLLWGIGGGTNLKTRALMSAEIQKRLNNKISLPTLNNEVSLIDYQVKIEDGEWHLWKKKVPTFDIDPQRVTDADLIITTVDTLRHQQILCSWINQHRPFILCGPPGSGKTMTLMSTLKSLPQYQLIFVNFSSSTTPNLIKKQFQHYCQYVKTVSGIILRPKQPNKWLIVFCDQINLPDVDKYGTMPIITFLRQLAQCKGFWRTTDRQWVSMQRIQFVGACNPPTDIGRKPLSSRFLRHCPLILVDFPGKESLLQIFGTFNKAMLKKNPMLRSLSVPLTNAMVDFYMQSQLHFTSDIQPHYIYSPRQLTRWKYAINQALQGVESEGGLVRLWSHQAMRLFEDRLVLQKQKQWCEQLIDRIAFQHFKSIGSQHLQRPILFSTYLSRLYLSVSTVQLRKHIEARLKIFYEEEMNVKLVLFDQVLQHILRIDRVLKQPLGHLLLVGASGVGKTTLSRFVSWMNNITVFQIKAGRNYSLQDFDNDLREVMKKSGVRQQKICFIFDESNALSPSFLEKMNALLASGQIPGLFEGQQYMSLINQCRQASTNKMIDSEEELYRNFIKNVQKNLHVIFTMNPANPDFSNRTASSPALFNRCVIDWFGDWPKQALYQVADTFTKSTDTGQIQQGNLVIALVECHMITKRLNQCLQMSSKRFNYLTPRDFLSLIKHFTILFEEKKSRLEGQQLHLNMGLNKLVETEKQVAQMGEALNKKSIQLTEMETKANQKLKQMLEEQSRAKVRKEEAEKLRIEVSAKQKQIDKEQTFVQERLAKVQPTLKAAKSSVESLTAKQLDYIKSLPKPPEKIKFTMQAVICLSTNSKTVKQWKDIRNQMGNTNFKNSIMTLKSDDIKKNVKDFINKNYLNNQKWNIDDIMHASPAAGALALWVKSQIEYIDILLDVQPLRKTITSLQAQSQTLINQSNELQQTCQQLQKTIAGLKLSYEQLISQKQMIVTEMSKVEQRLNRSKGLLKNLASQKSRWKESSLAFKNQLSTMVGDVILSGAFLTYVGFFDHFYRKILISTIKNMLIEKNIKFREELSMLEFLSTPNQRLHWKSHKLPSDDLCIQNAIIMKRYLKYPLIIDPAGQALQYLLSLMADKKCTRSSFRDDSFMKALKTSIQFGCPLIVQDVEKVEPILNSVLNKEVYQTGGRVLIRVGDQEVDFSSTFSMFMITRDSNIQFPPDLCSRVTFINFTTTPSSLQQQCLNIFLKNQRPDIEEKRINLMKIQGEYIVRLRELENMLLDSLSNLKCSILDSQEVIATLQKLKTESSKINEEMQQSSKVLEQVSIMTNSYRPLAQSCSKIFFSLKSMQNLYYLYQFSLNYFMKIIYKLLHREQRLKEVPIKEVEKRKEVIMNLIYQMVYVEIQKSLLQKDKMILAIKLCQLKSKSKMFNLLYEQPNILQPSLYLSLIEKDSLRLIEHISTYSQFSQLTSHIQHNQTLWQSFINSDIPQKQFPLSKGQGLQKLLFEAIILRIFRPDRMGVKLNQIIKQILGRKCSEKINPDLQQVIAQGSAKQPIIMSSAPGFDPSFKVQQLTKEGKLKSVAIGSKQGFQLAQSAINQASKLGNWVLLKNVHLAPSFLSDLQKKIHRLQPNPNFRLFLTSQFYPKIPPTLIRQSMKLVYQPPDGIKASLLRIYKNILVGKQKPPFERERIHFLLAWLHSVVIQRLRYIPIGWTKVYEFNEADQRCALDLMDEYINSFGDRSNLDINKIPWEAFRTMLIQNLYGGKIDNEYDSKILESIVNTIFTSQAYDEKYALFQGNDALTMPGSIKQSQFIQWIQKLPNVQSPTWSYLPANAQKLLKSSQAKRWMSELLKLQDLKEQKIELIEKKSNVKNQDNQVEWLKNLKNKVSNYLDIISKIKIVKLERTQNCLNDPLFRFLQREITVTNKLFSLVLSNLSDVKDMCEGKVIASSQTKSIAKQLHNDVVVTNWAIYNIETSMTASVFIIDFSNRLNQFSRLIQIQQFQKKGVWLGGLIFPQAFMTATRQYVAQRNMWSLQQLELQMKIYKEEQIDDNSFLVKGLAIQGATIKNNCLQPLQEHQKIFHNLQLIKFTWNRMGRKRQLKEGQIMIPFYLNRNRKNLILSIRMQFRGHRNIFYQKGVAIIAWSSS